MQGKCQYKCSEKTWKNLGAHEANCKLNPKNASKQPEQELEKPTEQPKASPIIIIEVQPYNANELNDGELVAWFATQDGANRYYRTPQYQGIIVDGYNQVPSVLVTTSDGTLMPPALIPGFVGMFAKDQEFESQQPQAEEPHPEVPKEPANYDELMKQIKGKEGDNNEQRYEESII